MNINKFKYFFYFLKNKNLIENFYKKNIVILKILQIKKKNILLEGNLKSECFINFKNFDFDLKLKIKENQYFEFFINNLENLYGKIKISRINLKNYIFWKNIIFKYKNKDLIYGLLNNKVKGGYSILLNNFKGFLPFSCSDKKINNNYYLGKYLHFIIFNIDIIKKNIILSRKSVFKKILKIKRKIFFKNINVGGIIKGLIKSINNYCLFVDIGYLDCIMFHKNIFWGNYKYSYEILKINQSILGVVLKIDKKKFRVFLGLKQLFNSWNILKNFKNFLKYSRIVRMSNNNFLIVIGKNNILTSTYNFELKFINNLKINNYLKLIIKNFNFKKKRLIFEILPPLA